MADSPKTEQPVEEQTPEQRRALFRVVRGEPDDAEVAALTAVIAVAASPAASAADADADRRGGVWADRQSAVRQQLRPGPGAWKAHYRPR